VGKYAIDGTNIKNFIFHVIHHGEDKPTYLEEADIEGFTEFFHARLKDTATGDGYKFNSDSRCKELITEFITGNLDFVFFSQKIAKLFNDQGRSSVKPGALVVMIVGDDVNQYLSLIKFDHEEIVSYKIEHNKALLEEIQNNFTRSKKAMQKSVLINISNNICGDLLVIDRNSNIIADFFRKFLDAQKIRNDKENTKALCNILTELKNKFKYDFSPDFRKSFTGKVYTVINNMDYFDKDIFFDQLFSEYANNEKLKKKYDNLLEKHQLIGEKFKPDSNVPTKPKYILKKTKEGIDIKIPIDAIDTVKEQQLNDANTQIIITTREIVKDEPHYK
jgi:nucleoid-associated protein YejK